MSDSKHEHTPKHWIGCDVEAEFFGEERKTGKIERKLASSKDRSKYKKTDLDKAKRVEANKIFEQGDLLRGRVLSIIPQGIVVDHENETVVCTLRGLLKKDKSQFKNLVTVGDFVLFEKTHSGEGMIAHVEARKTVLSRADNLSRRKEQLIAANIDQVLITASVVQPSLKSSLIDRYLIATEKGGMDPIIVINKIDLLLGEGEDILLEEEKALYQDFLHAYKKTGFPVIAVSTKTGEGLDDLKALMKDKASVFSGQSGVGKSSLINAVAGSDLRVGHIVEKTNKGTHTTTTTNLLQLPFGGWCIDTPGIKSFGVWNLKADEIETYFPEIHTCGEGCKYLDCTHDQETDCAVYAAVERGEISLLRYLSYQNLMQSVDRKHKRR
ncbi:MAG: ribosome small subunit-dependent GTPase A [Parachlamydiaceae bacterium]|nr:ribosome small subunit-dependent GTPase A [Parachlamydiaceae bacterium]